MKKGYFSKDLLEWTRTFHKYYFFIHGMFIFGYPQKLEHNKNNAPDKVNKQLRLLKSVQRSFLKNTQPLITGEDGLKNMKLMEMLEKNAF